MKLVLRSLVTVRSGTILLDWFTDNKTILMYNKIKDIESYNIQDKVSCLYNQVLCFYLLHALHIPVVNTMYTLWSDSLTCDVSIACL